MKIICKVPTVKSQELAKGQRNSPLACLGQLTV